MGEILLALVLYGLFTLLSVAGGYLIARRFWTHWASVALAAAILLFYLVLLWGLWWLVQ